MAFVYSYDDITPIIDFEAYVHETAVLIGDVIVEKHCYIGPGAVLRGDFGRIHVHIGSNVQETCVIHSFPSIDVVLEPGAHIGHGAILHGCTVGENALVGMNAVIMDKAHIGKDSIVGALSFVKAGAQFGAQKMIVGSPAKAIRALSDEELAWKSEGTSIYQNLARQGEQLIKRVEPLNALEPNRRRVTPLEYDPLSMHRQSKDEG